MVPELVGCAGGALTGMTRFATFWVEDGRIQGPVGTMRFDDSLYDFLGTHWKR